MRHMHRYIHPWSGNAGACWHCNRFVRMLYEGTAAQCSREHSSKVRSQPETGCSAFEREPGADDEPGPPMLG